MNAKAGSTVETEPLPMTQKQVGMGCLQFLGVCKHWKALNNRMKPSIGLGFRLKVTRFDIAGAARIPKTLNKASGRVLPSQPRSAGLVQSSRQANTQTLHLLFRTSLLDDHVKLKEGFAD